MDLSHNNRLYFDKKLCKTSIVQHMSGKKQCKKRPESTTSTTTITKTKVLCLASAVFIGIPVVQGFAPSGQSEFRILRQQLSDLKYRVHDNSEERQSQHRKATVKLLSRASKHSEPKHHVVSNIFHTWWTASKSRRAHEQAQAYAQQQEQQLILDNYLESIDRRYKRLHKDHISKSKDNNPDAVKNVAWNFLMNAESVDYIEEQRRQMDAIYVLGLAELASERLLQKHNLPLPQSKLKDKSIIDVQSTQDFDLNQATTESFITDNSPAHYIKAEANSLKILAATTYCVQLLKFMQDAYRNRLLSLFHTARTTLVGSLKSSRKAIGTTVSTAANLIQLNGDGIGKYAINFIYIFAATFMANAFAFLRLMIKAA